ncbi:hypothetical protein BURPS1710A_4135 [Burkholderia pseudomallei 1710a]|uniref:Uncharacterized protein n=1 Tax=Burkholderia pseudomallei 1710a TaxID=320371 RepID=A0A0E1WCL9_BURPE|nr:hypothetical protein BURPS1710A_4135 [Burkholderia pseudomallei 1710a]EXJ00005.1 hypothetical protein T210_0124585 [Burkholderia pseudomallei MSHR6137]
MPDGERTLLFIQEQVRGPIDDEGRQTQRGSRIRRIAIRIDDAPSARTTRSSGVANEAVRSAPPRCRGERWPKTELICSAA